MKALLATILLFATPAAADVSIVKNHAKKTVDCRKQAKNLNIVGNHAKINILGACGKVMIAGNHAKVSGSATTFYLAGNHNVITADATDDITVPGNHNTVVWARGLSVDEPSVSAPGNENKISRK